MVRRMRRSSDLTNSTQIMVRRMLRSSDQTNSTQSWRRRMQMLRHIQLDEKQTEGRTDRDGQTDRQTDGRKGRRTDGQADKRPTQESKWKKERSRDLSTADKGQTVTRGLTNSSSPCTYGMISTLATKPHHKLKCQAPRALHSNATCYRIAQHKAKRYSVS